MKNVKDKNDGVFKNMLLYEPENVKETKLEAFY
jgi:hypothetical protein